MATKMHRLQISLPHEQARFLEERARLAGVSMAEVVRRLIEREAESAQPPGNADGIWDVVGIAEDRGPLIDGVAVSESPELYIARPGKRKRRS